MISKFLKVNPVILCSCAVVALSACESSPDDIMYAFKHPAEAYYGTEEPSGANYDTKQREVKGYNNADYSKKKSVTLNSSASHKDDVDIAFANSTPAAGETPAYSITVDENDGAMPAPAAPAPAPQFINGPAPAPATPAPAMISGEPPAATPAPMPAEAPIVNASITGCPHFEIYPDMRSITFFKGGDKTKLIASASIGDVRGSCRMSDGHLELDLKVLIDGQIGPHGRYQSSKDAEELQSYPYYVALVNKATGKIEYKKIHASILRFPSSRNVQSKYENIISYIPIPNGQTPNAYTLNIGFQLTPEQLSYNRGEINVSPQPVITSEITTQPPAPAPAPMGSMAPSPAPAPGYTANVAPSPLPQGAVTVEDSAPQYSGETISENGEGMTPLSDNTPVENAYIGTYKSSETSVSRDRRFLRGRPRVSIDPLAGE